MFIIGWLAKALIARGLSTRLATAASWGLTIAGAALLAFAGWSMLKRSIIADHDAGQRAEQAERQLERTHKADTVVAAIESRDRDADTAIKGAIDEAVRKDAAGGTVSTGPVTGAAVDELRASRRKRSNPPAD